MREHVDNGMRHCPVKKRPQPATQLDVEQPRCEGSDEEGGKAERCMQKLMACNEDGTTCIGGTERAQYRAFAAPHRMPECNHTERHHDRHVWGDRSCNEARRRKILWPPGLLT